MKFVKFTEKHQYLAQSFDCENFIINTFLRSSDALDSNQGITYILLDDEETQIVGFYNIGMTRIDQTQTVGEDTYYYPMGGAAVINYLAVTKDYKHHQYIPGEKYYYGDYILNDCEEKLCELRKRIGFSFIMISSTKEGYHLYHDRNFYDDFDDDMSIFLKESDKKCYLLYKWADDLEFE